MGHKCNWVKVKLSEDIGGLRFDMCNGCGAMFVEAMVKDTYGGFSGVFLSKEDMSKLGYTFKEVRNV